jgi:hypothetical protein
MAVLVCPRCKRANPSEAVFCYFDGGSLVSQQDGAQRLGHDFLFPSGRRCKTMEEFANGCQDEWATARDFLLKDAFRQYFISLGRHDLARLAQESIQQDNPDLSLTRFLDSLPVTRTNVPKLDLQPRRFFLGRLPTGEIRELDIVFTNAGKGSLQGTVSISEGEDWLSLPDGEVVKVAAGKEQRLKLMLDLRSLKAAQTYAGQLRVVTNGGVAEVPIRFEVVARPFAKAPFQGVKTPRELAEKMRDQPKQAGPLLESGDIERWFEGNNWAYPVVGPIAKGLAGVQQFFEAMGLSKPPKLQLSQKEVRFSTHYPDAVRFQVVLQTQARKWVYGQISSDHDWLKVLTPKVIGPQQANILVEADPTRMAKFPPEDALIIVQGNGGQKLNLRVVLEVKDAPRPEEKNRWQPVPVFMVLFVLLRLLLVPLVDFHVADAAAREAAERVGIAWGGEADAMRLPWVSLLAGFDGGLPDLISADGRNPQEALRLARDFRRHFVSSLLRDIIFWTWWIFAALIAVQMARARQDGSPFAPSNLVPAILAGSVAGILAAATVACVFVTIELFPHVLWAGTFGAAGIDYRVLWIVIAVLGWAVMGAFVGFIVAAALPVKAIVYPSILRFVVGIMGLCGLRGLARRLEPNT